MNKKRIALALAAGLSLNALVVTVGQVNGQAQIAHAQESRVTTPEDIANVNSIEINKLDISVKSVEGEKAVLDIKGIDLSKVTKITGNLKNGNTTARVSRNNAGQVVVTGLKDSGIYSGDISITDDKGTTKYALTIKKSVAQEVLTLTNVNVGTANITVDGVKIGNTNKKIDATEAAKFTLTKSGDASFRAKGTEKGSKLVFPNVKLTEGEYKVTYKDGTTEVSSSIYVFKSDNATITNYFATNNSVPADKTAFTDSVAIDYGIAAATYDENTAGRPNTANTSKPVSKSIKDNNTNTTLLTFSQSEFAVDTTPANNKLGGAKITFDEATEDITIGNFTSKLDNFVGAKNIGYSQVAGNTTEDKYALVGEYKATVTVDKNPVTTISYYDATKEFSYTLSGAAPAATIQTSSGIMLNKTTKEIETTLNINKTVDLGELSHGYQTVSVQFNVVDNTKDLINKVKDDTGKTLTAAGNVQGIPANKVTTSVIIGKDALDGISVNSSFKKIDDTTGELVLTTKDVNELLKAAGAANINGLVVDGGNVTNAVQGAGTLTYTIKFNGTVPSEVKWNLGKVQGTTQNAAVEVVNLVNAQASNSGTGSNPTQFTLDLKFNGVVPSDATITIKDSKGTVIPVQQNVNGTLFVDLAKFVDGIYTVEAKKETDTYTTSMIVSRKAVTPAQDITVKITEQPTVGTDGKITVKVDADFKAGVNLSNVKGKLVFTNTSNNVITEQPIAAADIKDPIVTITSTTAFSSGTYKVKAVYEYDENGTKKVFESGEYQVVINSNNGSGIVSGGSGSTTTPGNSVGSTTITSTSSNTTSDSDTVNITLPSGVNYDSNKTPVAVKFIYKGLDGKTVTENKEQYSNVVARFENGKVVVDGLVPGKEYTEISVDYTDNNGRTRTLILKDVKTTATKDLDKYLADVYTTIFKRPADEAGYHFHLKNLGDKKTSLREFLLNLLTDKEFGENYKTPSAKIDGLYAAIVARTPDQAGKDFWTAEYNKAVKTYGSEALALQAIADRMVNEPELKTLAEKMNVQW